LAKQALVGKQGFLKHNPGSFFSRATKARQGRGHKGQQGGATLGFPKGFPRFPGIFSGRELGFLNGPLTPGVSPLGGHSGQAHRAFGKAPLKRLFLLLGFSPPKKFFHGFRERHGDPLGVWNTAQKNLL